MCCTIELACARLWPVAHVASATCGSELAIKCPIGNTNRKLNHGSFICQAATLPIEILRNMFSNDGLHIHL